MCFIFKSLFKISDYPYSNGNFFLSANDRIYRRKFCAFFSFISTKTTKTKKAIRQLTDGFELKLLLFYYCD
ncbi:hypothetical protein LH29_24160 [Draconibacterium sediminis]|uniref:Uncharacterized protein n=1 Tax=Draconibacterium sediminis TaxID=1544798 RepID=A0A0D8J5C5_9BACT|nr:hypothetical protein LH29_24160 [Draconibacterium sediminis]